MNRPIAAAIAIALAELVRRRIVGMELVSTESFNDKNPPYLAHIVSWVLLQNEYGVMVTHQIPMRRSVLFCAVKNWVYIHHKG